jgi:hypothetical protein
MSTVTLGFQTNSGTSNITFFDIPVSKDGKQHKASDLISKATSGGNPVKVPADFLVNEILLNKPAELSRDGKVEIDHPSGSSDHRTTDTLTATKSNLNIASVLSEIKILASK